MTDEKLKKFSVLLTDEDAIQAIGNEDLTEYDLSGFKPVKFEFERKDSRLNMRVPAPLLDAIKQRAAVRGIPYQRFIREIIETALNQLDRR